MINIDIDKIQESKFIYEIGLSASVNPLDISTIKLKSNIKQAYIIALNELVQYANKNYYFIPPIKINNNQYGLKGGNYSSYERNGVFDIKDLSIKDYSEVRNGFGGNWYEKASGRNLTSNGTRNLKKNNIILEKNTNNELSILLDSYQTYTLPNNVTDSLFFNGAVFEYVNNKWEKLFFSDSSTLPQTYCLFWLITLKEPKYIYYKK